MLLPGPEAQQLAIYIGWLLHRTAGGIVAGAFFVIPSIVILLGLSYVYAAYGNLPVVAGVLAGFKPVVVAIVAEAILKIGGRALKVPAHFVIAAAAFAGIYVLHIPFPLIVVGAGLAGLVLARAAPRFTVKNKQEPGGGQGRPTARQDAAPAATETVIDDRAPAPAHTLPSGKRLFRVLAAGVVLWTVPLALLVALKGWDSLYVQEYRFFSQAALVTFGGAYSVLAYVTQAAVGSYGWISHGQAIDGLALAETTPGPLIMVLQFIGFMAGWNNPAAQSQIASGIAGALVATYATFLPCFLFIFAGGPYIEMLRGNKSLTSALSGVTAAVVGVILNLALVFGATVIWPSGLTGGTNWFALLMSAGAFVALRRFKADVVWIVVIGGVIGLLELAIFRR
jgi:chromate transporter